MKIRTPPLSRVLTTRIIAAFSCAIIVFGIVFGIISSQQNEKRFESQWRSRFDTTLRILGPVLMEADFALAVWIGEQLDMEESVGFVHITDTLDRELYRTEMPKHSADDLKLSGEIISPLDRVSVLGKVSISISRSEYPMFSIDTQRPFLWAAFGVCVALGLGLYLLIETYVTRPLERLRGQAEAFRADITLYSRSDDPHDTREMEAIETTLEQAAREISEQTFARDSALRNHRAELERRVRISGMSQTALASAGLAVFSRDVLNDNELLRLGADTPQELEPVIREMTTDGDMVETLLTMSETRFTRQEHERFVNPNDPNAPATLYQFEIRTADDQCWLIHAVRLENSGMALICNDISNYRRMQSELYQAQKADAIAQLTGGVAHDFNNLLGIIQANAEILLARGADEKSENTFREIIEASGRGAKLTRSLLSFAREARLEEKTCDLGAIIGNVMDWVARVLPETIETKVMVEGKLWPIRIDPDLAGNALLNLLLNARDAMPEGGILTIESSNAVVNEDYIWRQHEDARPGRYVLLTVTDSGHGIPEDIRERIFDPFFTTKDVGAGSGVGLAMVYGFMKQSGGMIHLYSEVGRGTSFRLYFPVSDETPDEKPSAPLPVVKPSSDHRVFLIEDNQELRGPLVSMLESSGYQVDSASRGSEALEMVREGLTCDVVLTDVIMPGGMTGPEFIIAARDLGFAPPVVYMSGYSREAFVRSEGLDATTSCLMKPFSRGDLVAAIEAAISSKKD